MAGAGFSAADAERWIPRLRRYALALTGNREAADDLTQDALERAWLFTVMHNVYVNGVRSARATESLDEDGPTADAVSALPAASAADGDVVLSELRVALALLVPEQREVVLLVGLEQMSYAEAASGAGGTDRYRYVAPGARTRAIACAAGRRGSSPGRHAATGEIATMEEEQLHAYVDGAATEEERRVVEAAAARDPVVAARLRAYERQNQALHDAFDGVLNEPHSLRLPEARSWDWSRWGGMAATLLLGVACGFIARGWVAGPGSAPVIAREAVLAHAAYVPEVRHPVEVTVSEEQHLVAWLSKRLSTPTRAPSLVGAGYQLLVGACCRRRRRKIPRQWRC